MLTMQHAVDLIAFMALCYSTQIAKLTRLHNIQVKRFSVHHVRTSLICKLLHFYIKRIIFLMFMQHFISTFEL